MACLLFLPDHKQFADRFAAPGALQPGYEREFSFIAIPGYERDPGYEREFFFIAIPGYEREFQDCRLDIEERLRRDIETETDVESNGKNHGPICFLPCMYTYVIITRVVVLLYNCCWSFASNVSLICLFNPSVFSSITHYMYH